LRTSTSIFFFLAENVGHGLDHVLANGVAVFDEFHFIALHQQIHDLVGDAHDFFAGQSHSVVSPLSLALQIRQSINAKSVCGRAPAGPSFFEHFLVRNSGAAHLVLVLVRMVRTSSLILSSTVISSIIL